MSLIVAQQHANGVHLECKKAECERAGKVERFHSHDYDGLIICCDED